MAAQTQLLRQIWQGKACAKLPNTPAHHAWNLVRDFGSLHKLLPALDDCHLILVDGAEVLPGSVRFCASAAIPTADGTPVAWAKEKLLAVDHQGLSYTYEVIDSNIGFGRYVTSMKVLPEVLDADAGRQGCRLEWSFEGDPLEGWTQDGLVSFLEGSLQVIANNVEATHEAAAVNARPEESPAPPVLDLNVLQEKRAGEYLVDRVGGEPFADG